MAGEKDEKARRIDASAQLASRALELTKVKGDARIGALHDMLMYAIELAAKEQQQGKPVFTQAQIRVLKDLTCHLLLMIDTQRKPNWFVRGWREFTDYTVLRQLAIIGGIVTALLGAPYSAWKGYREFIEWYAPKVPVVAPTVTTPTPPIAPAPAPPVSAPPPAPAAPAPPTPTPRPVK